MTRAEERGLEALPPRWRKTKDGKGKVDSVLPVRQIYIRAYEQAEKDLGWHSVDECLPELGEEVIVMWFEYGEVRATPLQCVGLSQLYQPIQCVPSGEKLWTIPGVKYWMPMPKLPEEEEK